jgi:hypothetical protein
MAEQSFLNEDNVSVTQSHVTIGGAVYPTRGITAIRTAIKLIKCQFNPCLGPRR